jgi:hypothetical protein
MPEAKKKGLKLGTALGISNAPSGLLQSVQGMYQQYVPEDIKHAIETIKMTGRFSGLEDPSTGYGGSATNAASIAQLAADDMAPAALRKLLQAVETKYPRFSKLVKNSRFITDPAEEWGDDAAKLNRTGSYDPNLDEAVVSLNKANGMPREPEDILETTLHEHVHGSDANRGIRDKGKFDFRKKQMEEFELPYKQRPSEQKAKRIGSKIRESIAGSTIGI